MPIVMPKPEWRVKRQAEYARKIAVFDGRYVRRTVRELFLDIISGVSLLAALPVDTREKLEDLYDALVERGQTDILLTVWDSVEAEQIERQRARFTWDDDD